MKQNQTNIQNQYDNLIYTQNLINKLPLEQNRISLSTQEMIKLLSIRNKKYIKENSKQQNIQQWLINKGVNLNDMKDFIKLHYQIQVEQMKKQNLQQDCIYFMKCLNLNNQKEYIIKNYQFGISSTIQSLMSSNKVNGNFIKRHLEKRIGNQCKIIQYFSNNSRNYQKVNQYIQLTCLGIQKYLNILQIIQLYLTNIKYTQYIQILFYQIRSVQKQSQGKILQKFSQGCLKMIQKQFDQQLPKDYQNILRYITNNYLDKVQGRYLRNKNFGPVWGVAFFLFRAGRKKQFLQLISFNQQIHSIFVCYFNNQNKNKLKIKQSMLNLQKDIFLEQLLYIVNGKILYSDEALCDIQKKDLIWILLKTAGITNNINYFNHFRQNLNTIYKNSLLNYDRSKNLFYIGSYKQLIQFGTNDFMDSDDIVHFLILITKSTLIKQKDQLFLKKMCSQKLLLFIQQLIFKKRKQYLNYMLLFPSQFASTYLTLIIYNCQLTDSIDWHFLKQRLSSQIFDKTIKQLIHKLAPNGPQNIQQICKLSTLIENNNQEYLIQYFIQTKVVFNFDNKINSNITSIIQKNVNGIFQKNQLLKNKYQIVFVILYESAHLKQLKRKKQYKNLLNILKNSSIVFFQHHIPHNFWQALNILQIHKGFLIYIQYLKNFAEQYKIINLFYNDNQVHTIQICTMIFNSIKNILDFDPFSKYLSTSIVVETMTFLAQQADLKYI